MEVNLLTETSLVPSHTDPWQLSLGYSVVQSELPMSGILFSVQLVRHLMSTVIGGSGNTSLIVLERRHAQV